MVIQELPEDTCRAINDMLRPLKNPPLLCLNIREEKNYQSVAPKQIVTKSATTLPDELDIATLLWQLQLHIERPFLMNDGIPDTTCLQLTAKDQFVAVWTCWRDKEGTGICYDFRHHSGAIFSGRRRTSDKPNNIADWDQKLALFRPLPKYQYAGRDSLAYISTLPRGLQVKLEGVSTGFGFMKTFSFQNACLSVQKY